jgi:hypothetical protein
MVSENFEIAVCLMDQGINVKQLSDDGRVQYCVDTSWFHARAPSRPDVKTRIHASVIIEGKQSTHIRSGCPQCKSTVLDRTDRKREEVSILRVAKIWDLRSQMPREPCRVTDDQVSYK